MPARGIIGRKPNISSTSSAYSDVFGCDYQLSVSTNSSWPVSDGTTGEILLIGTQIRPTPFIVYRKFEDGKYHPISTFSSLPTVGNEAAVTVSTNTGDGGTTCRGGTYVATLGQMSNGTTSSTNVLYIFKRVNGIATYNYLTTLVKDDTRDIINVEFDPTGTYLAMGVSTGNGRNRLRIWKRTGDTFTELTVADPFSGSASTYSCKVSWNESGTTLALALSISPFIAFYERSGDTFTRLATPATIPTSQVSSNSFMRWNHSGTSFAIVSTGAAASGILIYNRSGNTFTAITGLPTLYGSQGEGNISRGAQMSWSPDDTLLVIPRTVSNVNGAVAVYSRSGDTFTLANTYNLFGITGSGTTYKGTIAAFTNNGSEIIVCGSTSLGYVEIWDVSGATFSRPYALKWAYITYNLGTTQAQVVGTAPYLGNGYNGTVGDNGSAVARFVNYGIYLI